MAEGRNLVSELYSARAPDAPLFLTPEGTTVTTRAALERIGRMSAALAELGVRPGDRMSVKLDKSLDAILLAHACFHRGAILHPLNTGYTDPEIGALLADAEPTLLVCEDAERDRLVPIVEASGMRVASLSDIGGFADAGAGIVPPVAPPPGPHGAAALLYTSGTTGKPKGALITHANLIENARALATIWQLGPDDVLLHALPVYHAHGLLTSLNTFITAGGSVLLLPRFEPDAVLSALSRTTVMMGVPTHYARLAAEPALKQAIGADFRFAISGSAPLPTELGRRFEAAAGVPIVERYGSTEAAIVAAVLPERSDRLGWVGWALPGVEIRVAAKDGTTSTHGIGILETRGPHVFAGYWRNEAATAAAFTEDGCFVTGDIAEIDDGGCVRILGRDKDLIISGGLNVYPAEIEDALLAGEGIAAAAVFGVPHPDFGEAVVAAVEIAPGRALDERGTIAELRTRLAAYKTPKRVLSVDAIPRNTMGKMLKGALRDTYADLFASPETPSPKT